MTNYNPYVQNLIEMGYDEQDCRNVAAVGELNPTYPRTIYGRTFATESEYKEALADFINGLWIKVTHLQSGPIVWATLSPFDSGLSI